MKKKIWIPIVIVAILAILFIPIPRGVYRDGGTREYTALTYKIVKWNRLTDDGIYKNTKVYFGEDRWQGMDLLWLEESKNVEHQFRAVITSIDGSWVNVTPVPGESEEQDSLNIKFFADELPNIDAKVGDTVEIKYLGNVPWTSSPQIKAYDWVKIQDAVEITEESKHKDALFVEIIPIEQLPKEEEKAILTGTIIGGLARFYYFEAGLEYYRHDVETNKYYKCILELPDGYDGGEIISLRSGAGSGEIELITKSTHNGENAYWGCIVFNEADPQTGKQELPSGIYDETRLNEMGINTELVCGYPLEKDMKVQLTDVSNEAVSNFALRLFKESANKGENTLISPLSVLIALSMTANGADNNTLSQMEAVLGMPIDQLNSWIKTYAENLPGGEDYKLDLANSIWINDTDSFNVNSDFLRINAEYYGGGRFKSPASIFKAPFDDSTLENINKWVEDNTDGMIKNILDEIPKDAIMYLVNALAFDAEWQKIYNERQVRDGYFITEDGTQRNVELMYSSENKYLEDENATGFIKYYKDSKYAFVALLPNEGIALSDYIATLGNGDLNAILENAKDNVVSAAIPKFEINYKTAMNDALSKMGMTDAFNIRLADFTKMGEMKDGKLYISRVIHQTYISVDSKGTRAGAATVVEMPKATATVTEPPKQVFLDRPFMYMLIDCENDIPFFVGTVTDING